jgi:hypothetical protein
MSAPRVDVTGAQALLSKLRADTKVQRTQKLVATLPHRVLKTAGNTAASFEKPEKHTRVKRTCFSELSLREL